MDTEHDVTRAPSGSALRERAQGSKAAKLQEELHGLDAGVATWADDFVFGQVWSRPGLEFSDRMLVAITALAVMGKRDQLRNYLFGAVQDGMEGAQIQESLAMLVVYAGFPTAISALADWRHVQDVCARHGIEIQ